MADQMADALRAAIIKGKINALAVLGFCYRLDDNGDHLVTGRGITIRHTNLDIIISRLGDALVFKMPEPKIPSGEGLTSDFKPDSQSDPQGYIAWELERSKHPWWKMSLSQGFDYVLRLEAMLNALKTDAQKPRSAEDEFQEDLQALADRDRG